MKAKIVPVPEKTLEEDLRTTLGDFAGPNLKLDSRTREELVDRVLAVLRRHRRNEVKVDVHLLSKGQLEVTVTSKTHF